MLHDVLTAAHTSDVATAGSCWVCVCIHAHDRESLFDSDVIRELHGHRFLVHSVQSSVVCFGKPLTGGLTLAQIAGLEPAEEHDRNEEENGNHRHQNAESSAVFVPWVRLTVFKIRVDVINEFKLEIYTDKLTGQFKVNQDNIGYLQIAETITTENR